MNPQAQKKIPSSIICIFLFTFFALYLKARAEFMPSTFSVEFVQSFLKVTGTQETTNGEIFYKAKGNLLLKEFKQDRLNALFIANPKTSWYYLPPIVKGEQGSVQENASSNIVIAKLFDGLAQGLKDNELYQLKKHKEKNQLRFIFSKKGQEELKIAEVVVTVDGDSELIPGLNEKQQKLFVEHKTKKSSKKKRRKKRNLSQDEPLFSFSTEELKTMSKLTMKQVSGLKLIYVDSKEVTLTLSKFKDNPTLQSDELFNAQDFSFKAPGQTLKLGH